MRQPSARHSICEQIVIEDLLFVPHLHDFGYDKIIELWMCLHSQDSFRPVESLNSAYRAMAEIDAIFWELADDVAVHLM